MNRPRLIVTAALALFGFGSLVSTARAELNAESMLSPTTVTAIDLRLPPASVAALELEPDEYVEGSFRIAETGGTPATIGELSDPLTVGVRLKGSAGSFEGLGGKAAFKIKFNEFVPKQKFLGLKGLTLNNMVQDPSMVHEAIFYEAFRTAGLEAPRTGYSYVHLNGVDYGLHLNLETMDDVALEERFGEFDDPQHLYEGIPLFDLTSGNAGAFEVDEGDEEDLSDLEALIAAAGAATPGFSERLAPVADLDQMTRFWAAERYLGHWDGYSGRSINNYYLYSDAAGVFQMLPWGADQTLVRWWYPFAGRGGTLFEQCLADEACFDAYVEDLLAVEASTAALDLAPRVDQLAALLAPWQELEIEEASRAPYGVAKIAHAVDDVREFLAKRPGLLANWLDLGILPPDPEERPEDEAPPNPGMPKPLESPPPIAGTATISGLEIDRSRLGRGLVIVRAELSEPGTVALTGTIGPSANGRACATAPRAVATGTATLHCRLSEPVRVRLRSRPLTLRLNVGFEPEEGEPLTLSRLVRLPGRKPQPFGGSSTESITWTTPLEASTSAIATFAPSIVTASPLI